MAYDEDEELKKIRQRKMMELQMKAAQQEQMKAQEEKMREYEQQKRMVLRKILSSEALTRLENIRLTRPDFAANIENQLIQIALSGQLPRLGVKIPIPDDQFKAILAKLITKKREFNIKFK